MAVVGSRGEGFARAVVFASVSLVLLILGGCDVDDVRSTASGPQPPPTKVELPARSDEGGGQLLPSISWTERLASERAFAASEPRYAPRTSANAVELQTSAARLTVAEGVASIRLGGAVKALSPRLARFGRRQMLDDVGTPITGVAGPEIQLRRAGLTEWWRALPSGIEHGVTIDHRPPGVEPLVVEVDFGVGFDALPLPEGGVAIVSGVLRVGRYEHLLVRDSAGTVIASRMEPVPHGVQLIVEDAAAIYPLLIDPLFAAEEAVLAVSGEHMHAGASVALSEDGAVAVVGAPYGGTLVSATTAGTAQVYRKQGAVWREEATLFAPDGLALDQFGYAVALSADGTRALIGSPRPSASTAAPGRAHVFVKTGGAWLEEAVLVASGPPDDDDFGLSVSLSADGSLALVGAPKDDTLVGVEAGTARVFARSGSSWTEQASLEPTAPAAGDGFGYAVVLAPSGTRAIVGAPYDDLPAGANVGTAHVFAAVGSTWTEDMVVLAAPDGAVNDNFGAAVAIASDASRVVVGAPLDDTAGGTDAGSVRVFLDAGNGVWTPEATLTAVNGASGDQLGFAVALSLDASRVLAGVPFDNASTTSDSGSVRVFSRTSTNWTTEATLAVDVNGEEMGRSIAITPDASVALVGAPRNEVSIDSNYYEAGTARVHVRTGTTWSASQAELQSRSMEDFAESVSMSADGTRVLISAAGTDTPTGYHAGYARIYVKMGLRWVEEALLQPSDAAPSDRFGGSVALSGDGTRALIGVPEDDLAGLSSAGSARVFVRSGSSWSEEATLVMADPSQNDRFGSSVAISADGSRAFVGSSADKVGTISSAGSVRVFVRVGTVWTQEALLVASDAANGDSLGWKIAVAGDGDRLVAGALGDDVAGYPADHGSVRVFARSGSTWTQEATLVTAANGLGVSLALSYDGATALIGVYTGVGSARVFARTGTAWTEAATLAPIVGVTGDDFARSVALTADGTRALIGMPNRSNNSPNIGVAHMFDRTGPGWEHVAEFGTGYTLGYDRFGWAVGLSANGSVALVGAPDDKSSPPGTWRGTARLYSFAPVGGVCASAAECPGGFCVDGVCCNNACGSGASDCQACSVAAGGLVDGLCGPLAAPVAATTVCRGSAGGCDPVEFCSPSAVTCPANAFSSASTVCRPVAGPCDVAESCSGSSAGCPTDKFSSGSVQCRAANGVCDVAENCSGASASCPTDAFAGTAVTCRLSAGLCDVAEHCTGSASQCPSDSFVSSLTVCRTASNLCDVAESCTGSSAACPTNGYAPSGTECRSSAGLCDAAEQCTGAGPLCPADTFAAAATMCRPSVGPCDVAESCTGASVSCPANALASPLAICRPTAGVCDVAETCSGVSPSCPLDGFATGATTCRASAGPCDVAEQCSGASPSCGADMFLGSATTCRASVGDCDAAEQCTGLAASCPTDAFAAAGAGCADNTVCTSNDTCSAAGMCLSGSALDCDDGNPCTQDACDAAVGCTHAGVTDGVVCDDGDPCTAGETCVNGACVAAGGQCEDNDPCTANDCDGQGGCLNTPAPGAACDDGDACTAADACDLSGQCAGASVDCDDGIECTADACDAGSGCTHDPLPDGAPCRGGVCSGGVCDAGTTSSTSVVASSGSSTGSTGSTSSMSSGMGGSAPAGSSGASSASGGAGGQGAQLAASSSDSSAGVGGGGSTPPIAEGCGCRVGSERDAAPSLAAAMLVAAAALLRASSRRRSKGAK